MSTAEQMLAQSTSAPETPAALCTSVRASAGRSTVLEGMHAQ